MPLQTQSGTSSFGAWSNSSLETSETFRQWAGTDACLLAGADIGAADLSRGGSFVVQAFHGTTHDFERFDAALRGNPEGAFGRVNYFTSSYHDAQRNYAGEGMDLAHRIECEAERLGCEIEYAPEAFGLSEEASSKDCQKTALDLIRRGLVGSHPHVKHVYLRFSNPFLVDGIHTARGPGLRSLKRDLSPLLLPETEGAMERAENKVLEENGLSHLAGEARQDALEDLEEALYECFDALREEALERLTDAVAEAAMALDIEIPDLPQSIFMDVDELTHQAFYDAMMADESVIYTQCPETGALIGNDIFSRILEKLGFDAIVLKNAALAFPGMEIPDGACHLHIFDRDVTNILQVSHQEVPILMAA